MKASWAIGGSRILSGLHLCPCTTPIGTFFGLLGDSRRQSARGGPIQGTSAITVNYTITLVMPALSVINLNSYSGLNLYATTRQVDGNRVCRGVRSCLCVSAGASQHWTDRFR